MKIYSIQSACVRLVAGLFLIFNQSIQAQTPSGEKAVEQLKQTGGYESLMEAVRAARQPNGQTDESNAPEAAATRQWSARGSMISVRITLKARLTFSPETELIEHSRHN